MVVTEHHCKCIVFLKNKTLFTSQIFVDMVGFQETKTHYEKEGFLQQKNLSQNVYVLLLKLFETKNKFVADLLLKPCHNKSWLTFCDKTVVSQNVYF